MTARKPDRNFAVKPTVPELAEMCRQPKRLLLAGQMRSVQTENVYPPIPIRGYDWMAYLDGHEEGPSGWGETEQQAIASLEESLAENE